MSKVEYYKDLNAKIHKLEKQLEQYKSLVKKVDADNLPNGEVLRLNKWEDGEFMLGFIRLTGKTGGVLV